MRILDRLENTMDIKKLSLDELKTLANEIREEIVSVVKSNGGHLSSNLGIVETTLALYYTFDFPSDKLVFDVGHQCYCHKQQNNFYRFKQHRRGWFKYHCRRYCR